MRKSTVSSPRQRRIPEHIRSMAMFSGGYPFTLQRVAARYPFRSRIPEDIRDKMYPQDVDGTFPMANRDAHTAYIGQIVAAYIIK